SLTSCLSTADDRVDVLPRSTALEAPRRWISLTVAAGTDVGELSRIGAPSSDDSGAAARASGKLCPLAMITVRALLKAPRDSDAAVAKRSGPATRATLRGSGPGAVAGAVQPWP